MTGWIVAWTNMQWYKSSEYFRKTWHCEHVRVTGEATTLWKHNECTHCTHPTHIVKSHWQRFALMRKQPIWVVLQEQSKAYCNTLKVRICVSWMKSNNNTSCVRHHTMLRRNKWEKRMTALMVNEIKHKSRRSMLHAQKHVSIHHPLAKSGPLKTTHVKRKMEYCKHTEDMECRRTSMKNTPRWDGDSYHSVINSGVSGYWIPIITCHQDMRDWAPVADIGYWNTR